MLALLAGRMRALRAMSLRSRRAIRAGATRPRRDPSRTGDADAMSPPCPDFREGATHAEAPLPTSWARSSRYAAHDGKVGAQARARGGARRCSTRPRRAPASSSRPATAIRSARRSRFTMKGPPDTKSALALHGHFAAVSVRSDLGVRCFAYLPAPVHTDFHPRPSALRSRPAGGVMISTEPRAERVPPHGARTGGASPSRPTRSVGAQLPRKTPASAFLQPGRWAGRRSRSGALPQGRRLDDPRTRSRRVLEALRAARAG